MLGFLRDWFVPQANPIGVDFGSDSIKMAQVQIVNGEPRLMAAAYADVPPHVRHNAAARLEFLADTTRDMLAQGGFKGRQAVLALPASAMFIQHLRMPKMDEEETRKALPWEARGKLPIDPSHAVMRHLVAGEVYQDSEPKNEVIVMAASRETVNQMLTMAAKCRLDVVGMNVEPMAIIDCFDRVYEQKNPPEVLCYVDMGCASSRVVIACGTQVMFARSIPIGGEHFNRAVANAMKTTVEDAKMLRVKLAHLSLANDGAAMAAAPAPAAAPAAEAGEGFALLNAALRASEPKKAAPAAAAPAAGTSSNEAQQQAMVEEACREPLMRLIQELDLCRRYYETTFSSKPVDKLMFVGGEARQMSLCQRVAQEVGLAAQIGDPMVRMGKVSQIGTESGIDPRQPQPGWAVAIGLSMGPSRHAAKAAG